MFPDVFECPCKVSMIISHFNFTTEHSIANFNNICQLHVNSSIFTRVRAWTDRQTANRQTEVNHKNLSLMLESVTNLF